MKTFKRSLVLLALSLSIIFIASCSPISNYTELKTDETLTIYCGSDVSMYTGNWAINGNDALSYKIANLNGTTNIFVKYDDYQQDTTSSPRYLLRTYYHKYYNCSYYLVRVE